ncbi:hypothetical protein BKA62DRAFT_500131 [Auriculariales sp. MPI-PUGE-AT-0066]|nr:hypothetical protein BKA62DRAFT_500131 [Auriculariales sp. MPI-PUGE-AT-0066]
MSASNNYISKVAIVGAGGNSGRYMTEALLATGKHTVTALTRPGSTSSLPAGVTTVTIDHKDKDGLVAALRGQDALIITLAVGAGDDVHSAFVEAAAAAGVPWVLPNEFTPDLNIDAGLGEDVPAFAPQPKQREYIASLGKSSFIAVSTGFWYEWSLSMPRAFGFDFSQRKVIFYDDGETKMSLSTWPQVGRAVASLLSLPVASDGSPSLNDYRNKNVFINSFTVTQKDIFESVLRVTGDKREDWTVEYTPSNEMFKQGGELVKTGDMSGFVLQIYSRVFYPARELGNAEKNNGVINTALKLKHEDLDLATRAGIKRAQEVKPFGSA